MEASTEHIAFASFALGSAALASVYDVRERRIPNLLTGPATVLGLALHLGLDGWHGLGSSLLAALAAGVVFLLFYLAGGMGAGDVKLMAAVGAILGLPPLMLVMLATVFAGALYALILAGYHGRLQQTLTNVGALLVHHGRRGLTPHPEMNLRNAEALRLPFALPIATGCLAAWSALAWPGVHP